MVQGSVDDMISNCFGHYELGIIGTVQMQLVANISQADARISDTDLAQAGLYDIVAQSVTEKIMVSLLQ